MNTLERFIKAVNANGRGAKLSRIDKMDSVATNAENVLLIDNLDVHAHIIINYAELSDELIKVFSGERRAALRLNSGREYFIIWDDRALEPIDAVEVTDDDCLMASVQLQLRLTRYTFAARRSAW